MQRQDNPRELARKVIALLEHDLETEGLSLLDVRIFRGGGRLQIRIYLDTVAGGITLDEVAQASRSVGMLLEEADLIEGQYVIEVSSPGIRRPLRTADHFLAAVGQRVDLKVKGQERPGRLRGVLTACQGDRLTIAPAVATDADPSREQAASVEIGLGAVLEANLDAEFDPQALINADRRRRKEEHRQARLEKKKRGRAPRPRKKSSDEPSDPGV